MATPRKWSKVAVAMESARAAAKAITAISKANPGVCTSTAHGYTNGDYIFLDAQGMTEVHLRVFRVAGVTSDTFQLEGEDTTLYADFSSGNAYKLTFGVSITTMTTVSSSGGEISPIPTTTIHDETQTEMDGVASALSYSFDNIWDVSDAGLKAMNAAYKSQSQKAFRFTFGTGGQIMAFAGSCGATIAPGGQAQGLVTTPSTIRVRGTPTYYAS